MLEVRGFRAWRFDPARVGPLDYVWTPPYDVLTPEDRRSLVEHSPHSMAHLILPEEKEGLDRYAAAARDFDAWRAAGVLRQDPDDSFYLLEQAFSGSSCVPHIRRGFLGIARLPQPGETIILGHERTFPRTTEDRFLLTRATRANLGPVFGLYSDPSGQLAAFLDQARHRPPDMEARTIDGVAQRLWRVPYDDTVTTFLSDKRLYIADGHHRFQTACLYRDAVRAAQPDAPLQPFDYVLMGFVSLSEPGLRIYPTHRLLQRPPGFQREGFFEALKSWFEVTPVDRDLIPAVFSAPGCALGLAIHGAGQYLLTLRPIDRTLIVGTDRTPAWRDLDVAILHRGILENVMGLPPDTQFTYERDAARALDAVESGAFGVAFLLKPTRADQIQACAEAGDPMPHKSTYFFPKLPTGAAIHRLTDDP